MHGRSLYTQGTQGKSNTFGTAPPFWAKREHLWCSVKCQNNSMGPTEIPRFAHLSAALLVMPRQVWKKKVKFYTQVAFLNRKTMEPWQMVIFWDPLLSCFFKIFTCVTTGVACTKSSVQTWIQPCWEFKGEHSCRFLPLVCHSGMGVMHTCDFASLQHGKDSLCFLQKEEMGSRN